MLLLDLLLVGLVVLLPPGRLQAADLRKSKWILSTRFYSKEHLHLAFLRFKNIRWCYLYRLSLLCDLRNFGDHKCFFFSSTLIFFNQPVNVNYYI